ncbi:hypothetical protein RRSWK_03492 [Rhodopirellula sp. SWK7]|nr:hypothetical protein RRSWK_03492 [Rhodopirellula sp. SWK7]
MLCLDQGGRQKRNASGQQQYRRNRKSEGSGWYRFHSRKMLLLPR